MSERKVLNKYYPPEFDPSKIPKLKQPKNRTFSIRIMAPFNMRCNTCGEYIYKGKKFNSRKENVDDEDYLGLRIFRFYIRCPRCVAEIAFKTDLANTDYSLEAGATRLFEAEKLAHKMAEEERKAKEEDELNPMKVLENRTKASRNEIEQLDQLEELKELNSRHARVDHETMLKQHMEYEQQLLKLEEQEEDNLVKAILSKGSSKSRKVEDSSSDDDETLLPKKRRKHIETTDKPTDILSDTTKPQENNKTAPWNRSVGSISSKSSLSGLVRKKTILNTEKQANKQNTTDVKNVEKINSNSHSGEIGVQKDVKSDNTEKKSTGLGLLGDYSDSSSGDSS